MANSTSTTSTDDKRQYASTTSTSGGSTSSTSSHTEGGSISSTASTSKGESHSKGGSSSASAGKTYASGEVAEKTQNQFDKYGNDYQQSENVTNAYNSLQAAISGKPAFQSTYEDKLASLYDQLMNRDKFSYNFNEDAMYQLYKDQFTKQGNRAMQDTMGQAAALTGGYGSSYAQTAGQQTYQNYLSELNNMIPQLRQQAYQEYQAEGQELLNKYNITNNAYNNEYGQYRDSVADWQNDRTFNYGMYSDERNFDYNKFADDRSYWQNEYWNERNAEQSNEQQTDENNWNDSTNRTDSWSTTTSNFWEDSSSHTNTSSWSNSSTSGWDNSQSTSATSKAGGGASAGGSGVVSTTPWTHNGTAGSNINSANIVQALYNTYKQDGQKGVDEALDDLKENGITTNGTTYTFTPDSLKDLQSELDSQLDNIYRYSGGKAGQSYLKSSEYNDAAREYLEKYRNKSSVKRS